MRKKIIMLSFLLSVIFFATGCSKVNLTSSNSENQNINPSTDNITPLDEQTPLSVDQLPPVGPGEID